jgi:hypothetical protein
MLARAFVLVVLLAALAAPVALGKARQHPYNAHAYVYGGAPAAVAKAIQALGYRATG